MDSLDPPERTLGGVELKALEAGDEAKPVRPGYVLPALRGETVIGFDLLAEYARSPMLDFFE
jgi:hypothetical protein